ncbi:MAG TPA: AAA family ATPase [Desulfuromonadales bacterium]|nr:AAA family ATPase [Desulfuromonadales bacterium]
MYESFFSLKEKPFALTPNPRFLFLSKTHNEVYAHLIYGIESRAGFVEVTGEVGTGKTTILRTLLSHLDESKYRVAFIFNPKLTAFELLRNINREFGIDDDGASNPDLIHSLNAFLLAENEAGRTPVLVIDEAQNLSGEVLEQIRLLSNLETEDDKLIQVILVGQPELRHHLSDHSLRQLNQRIAVRFQLRPLNREETASYILYRLNIAGRPDGNLFSAAALKRVFACSGGIPRRVNLICDRSLLTAYSEEHGIISARDVNQAVKELAGMGEGTQSNFDMPWKVVVFAAVAMLVMLVGFFQVSSYDINSEEALVQTEPAPIIEKNTAQKAESALLIDQKAEQKAEPEPEAPFQPRPDSLIASCNALLALWDISPLASGVSSEGFDIDQQFSLRGFRIARLAGDFETLSKFNVPLLVPLPEERGGGYLAVLGQTSVGMWSIAPAYQGRETLSTSELNNLGLQMALVPWIDFSSIGYVAVPGVKGENVRRLQYLLGLAGCSGVSTSGRFDPSSIQCVKAFQRQNGLIVDGLVGPRTLILLYQVAGTYKMPRLS